MRRAAEQDLSPAARERRRVRTPVLAVTGLAWLALAAGSVAHLHRADRATGAMGMPMAPAAPPIHLILSMDALPGFLGMWLLMLTAMMSPLLIGPLRHLGARSLPRRRRSARLLFIALYAAVWSVGGLALLAIAGLLHRTGAATAVAIGAALAWQCSPAKQRCLNRHHRYPPLAAFGRDADLAARRFGARYGAWCIGSCWALMLLPLVLPADRPAVMLSVSLWIWAEQFEFPTRATWRVRTPKRVPLIVRASITRLIKVGGPDPRRA